MNLRGLASWSLVACFVSVIGFIVLAASCSSRYRDVSHEAEHAELIGQQCVVLKGLVAYGATNPDGYHGLHITTPPGVGGREITFNMDVPKGTILKVVSVRECWNCPFFRISYGFNIDSIPRLATSEVFGYPKVLAPDEVTCTSPR